MSTTNTMPIEATQRMIDLRLDAIDRALLGLLPRNDRLATVAQVETRIRELDTTGSTVEASHQEQTERERLAGLSHLGEVAEGALFPSGMQPSTSPAGRRTSSSRIKRSRLALSSGVLGIVALVLLFVSPVAYFVIATLGASEAVNEVVAMLLLGTLVAAVAVGGTAAVILGIVALVRLNRRAGHLVGHGWAITGLCTGPLPMLAGGLIGLIAGMQSLAAESVNIVGVQTAAMPAGPMDAPYALPPQDASLPPSSPPPSMYAPLYEPGGNAAPAGTEEDFPTSRVPSEQPVLSGVGESGLEGVPESLPEVDATRELPSSSVPAFVD